MEVPGRNSQVFGKGQGNRGRSDEWSFIRLALPSTVGLAVGGYGSCQAAAIKPQVHAHLCVLAVLPDGSRAAASETALRHRTAKQEVVGKTSSGGTGNAQGQGFAAW